MRTVIALIALTTLSACATTANDLAASLCDQARHCNVYDTRAPSGPPQQRVIEPKQEPRPKAR